jgi:DNA mismatch repair protein MutS
MAQQKKQKTAQQDENEVNQYFQLSATYEQKYGKKCVLLYQMGSFFEIYGYSPILIKNKEKQTTEDNEDTEADKIPNILLGSCIKELNEFLELKIATTNKKYWVETGETYYPVFMSGFRDYSLDKYLALITANDYIAVVYTQKKIQEDEKKKLKLKNGFKRELFGIYSCGTFMNTTEDDLFATLGQKNDEGTIKNISNNILVLWIDAYKPFVKYENVFKENLIMGVAIYNLFNGSFDIMEIQVPKYLFSSTFDELQRIFTTYCPSETIIISTLLQNETDKIIDYLEIQSLHICKHFICDIELQQTDAQKDSKKIFDNCVKQQYLEYVVNKLFGCNYYQQTDEFIEYQYGTQAFAYLVHYLQEHNANFIKNIQPPIFHSPHQNVKLANYTLKQLLILPSSTSNNANNGNLSSLCSLLNKCITPMGKRKFYSQLVNPTTNVEWLEAEYAKINCLLGSQMDVITQIRSSLQRIDLEKSIRQLIIYEKITPNKIYQLHSIAKAMQELNIFLQQNEPTLLQLLGNDVFDFEQTMNELLPFLEKKFVIHYCKNETNFSGFAKNILQENEFPNIKQIERKIKQNENCITQFQNILNQYFAEHMANGKSRKPNTENVFQMMDELPTTEFIKKCETDKRGLSLQLTETKTTQIKSFFSKSPTVFELQVDGGKTVQIHSKDISFQKYSTTNNIIRNQYLQTLIDELQQWKEELDAKIAIEYLQIMEELKQYLKHCKLLISFIASVDCVANKALCSKIYNYVCPIICNDAVENGESFLDAVELRHPLVEHLNCNEIYVPNDVSLKNEKQMIIFGTNSAGKSSLVKSIGVAVIMAQSGMFVPATKFHFAPYNAIFSRIETKDNIHKGLSSFALEMSEFQIILKYADKNSLVIGDELCSGTETQSALSIFIAGMEYLTNVGCTYLFASHFHEIVKLEEIQKLKNAGLQVCHIAMYYDAEKDKMIYNRKLQKGSGDSSYGLEMCKSLKMPNDFLERAYQLRSKYFPENKGFLSQEQTKYNAKKIKEHLCEMCGIEVGNDVHHLAEQKEANKNGFIGTFHKNHPANLMTICKNCHQLEHGKQTIFC